MDTNALIGSLSALLVLVFIAKFSLSFERERHKVLSALVISVMSGAAIQYLGISELDGRLAAFLVASFVFAGSYLVCRLTTWLLGMRREERLAGTGRHEGGRRAGE